jgi:biopolymer transport protein ExbB
MQGLLEASGVYLWPLGACSLIAVFVMCERALALRRSRTVPPALLSALISGKPVDQPLLERHADSALGRLFELVRHAPAGQHNDLSEAVELESVRMERGLCWLDTIVSAAPLLGLLGTVAGLIDVFGVTEAGQSLPETSAFTSGIALALSTTMLGLMVALPALVGSHLLMRRVDLLSAELALCAQALYRGQASRGSRS